MDFSSLIAAVIGFIVAFSLGFPLIPLLKKLKFGQTILEEGPAWHASKQGTPTMGGVLFVVGAIISVCLTLLASPLLKSSVLDATPIKTIRWVAALGLAILMGFIGFIDDYIKVVKKRNLGLTARQKTFLQLLVSAAFLATLALSGMNTTWIPFVGEVSIVKGFGLIFWPIALMFIYGFTNAVNLTDGVDGLVSSVTVVVSCFFLLLAGFSGYAGANIISSALAGSLIGFLMWNSHPAKVFMGDTGSLFLGGAVVGLSFAVGKPILLLLVGIIYLVEAFSVILQVAYYKKTKKRLFTMSPLHHHFERCGWKEEKIVFVFSFVTLVFSLLAYFLFIITR